AVEHPVPPVSRLGYRRDGRLWYSTPANRQGASGHMHFPRAGGPMDCAASQRGREAPPESFVGGRYRVSRFLGEGSQKRVVLATDPGRHRGVARGVLKPEALHAAARTRLGHEARAMGRLGDHPNIVTIFDVSEEQGQPYIVTQYMAGGSVDGLLER